ncbi:MAG: hypothetical protein AMJ88_13220 [Anaerolineae bacterium SM23_ 63]|nr:MAG: hypothetical protein AMJ88_13220 [Anaerolineae bacterium SM23_ 63]
MLTERIIGAFTFRKGVYAEVEHDTSFTTTAWLLVAGVTFLNQLGSNVSTNFIRWILGAIVGTVIMVIGFGLAAAVISWVGRTLFNAEVTFEEMVRTLGLASVWNIIGFVGALVGFFPLLACVTWPAILLGVVFLIAAWFMAAKEALDLEWVETIVTVIVGVIAWAVVWLVTRGILGLLGLGAKVVGDTLGL